MGPINYVADVQDPFESVLQGFKNGAVIQDVMQQQQAKAMAMHQAQQMNNDLNSFFNMSRPTAKDYAAITAKHPILAERLKAGWEGMEAEKKQNLLSQANQVHMAIEQGQPQIARRLLTEYADAYKNSGDENNYKQTNTLIDLLDTNPDGFRKSTGLQLAGLMGPEKYAEVYGKIGAEQRASDLAPSELQQKAADAIKAKQQAVGEVFVTKKAQADATMAGYQAQIKGYEAGNTPQKLSLDNQNTRAQIKNIESQISDRAKRLNLDQEKLQSDVSFKIAEMAQKTSELTPDARKLINDSVIAGAAAEQSATKLNDLAGRLEAAGGGFGVAAAASEWFAKATGNQNEMTSLRQEYVRLRATEAAKMLPPGAASDKDIALALSGFPPPEADAKYIASFLRGMAKIQQNEAQVNSAKSEWVGSFGSLGNAKKDVEINGVEVKAGTSFGNFIRQGAKSNKSPASVQNIYAQIKASRPGISDAEINEYLSQKGLK